MKLYRPETFQGSLKKKNYFEGWYYKAVAPEGRRMLALIPGVSLGSDPHAFLQIIDGADHRTLYLRYGLEEFRCDPGKLDVRLGESRFLQDRVELRVDREETRLEGRLEFFGITPYPVKPWSPGIMGPYRFVPFMECYHGVVSADHGIQGDLVWDGKDYPFTGGRGYIEKDWGRSMPSSWIWIHSNLFEEEGVSFMLSVARIPWLGRSFTGHLAFLYVKGRYYRFATYTGSKFELLVLDDTRLELVIRDRRYALTVEVRLNGDGGDLKAPVDGGMERSIRERVDARVEVVLTDLRTRTEIYRGTGNQCGLEITGDDLFG
jgi:hypothetical protein